MCAFSYIVSSAATFDGTNLVRESNDGVIVVTIQYRLGIFGTSSNDVAVLLYHLP